MGDWIRYTPSLSLPGTEAFYRVEGDTMYVRGVVVMPSPLAEWNCPGLPNPRQVRRWRGRRFVFRRGFDG